MTDVALLAMTTTLMGALTSWLDKRKAANEVNGAALSAEETRLLVEQASKLVEKAKPFVLTDKSLRLLLLDVTNAYGAFKDKPAVHTAERLRDRLAMLEQALERQAVSGERGHAEGLATASGDSDQALEIATPAPIEAEQQTRPLVFIGSSAESLEVAETLQEGLDHDCEPQVWHQGIFGPGDVTIQALISATQEYDFAIFVVDANDTGTSRGQAKNVVRDNVIFELGLFMGALGPARVFMVYDRDQKPDLASDLSGITPATYARHRNNNMQAALGAPASQIRRQMRKMGPRQRR